VQASNHVAVQLGLQGMDALPVAQLQADDPVLNALHVEPLDALHLLHGEGCHQDAAALKGEVQLLLELFEHDGSHYLQAALEKGGGVVKTAVDDPGVGFGHTEGNVPFLLQNHGPAGVGGKLAGYRCADHSGADDRHVIDIFVHLPELFPAGGNSHRPGSQNPIHLFPGFY